jgi:hypothetical protein
MSRRKPWWGYVYGSLILPGIYGSSRGPTFGRDKGGVIDELPRHPSIRQSDSTTVIMKA